VWQAVDEQTGRQVALKLHRGPAGQDAAVRVSHPSVVSTFFLGTHEGAAYTVMELVDGVSLATVLEEGPIPRDDALAIAIGVCEALHAAHAAGVTHGNLKPSNVLIADQGVVKVGDFTGHGHPGEDMYSLGLLMEAMSGHRDPIVQRLLSRDPYTPAELRSILTGSPSPSADSPIADPDDGQESDRPRLVRLAVISGVATLAVVIAACAWFLKPSTPPDIRSEAPSGVPSLSGAGPDPVAEPSASPVISTLRTPNGPAAASQGISAAKAVIAGQLKAGNIERDAAASLNARLDDIARFLSRGQTKQANDRIDSLKPQLMSLLRAGKVTAAGYDAILASINKISA